MYKFSDGSNDHPPANDLLGSSSTNDLTVGLATFQFKRIGQPPALLQRLSASGPDTDYAQDLNGESRSPSPDLEDELLLSDSSPETLNTGQPSLRARIAMSEPPDEQRHNIDVDVPKLAGNDVSPATSLKPTDGEGSIRPKAVHNASPSICSSNNLNATSSKNSNELPAYTATITSSGPSLTPEVEAPSSTQCLPIISPTVTQPTNGTQTSYITSSSETPTLKSLRALQLRLSSANLNFCSTDAAHALGLAQTIKDQCVELLSTSRNAHNLAQRSIASARESMEASLKSLEVAGSLQMQTDEMMAAIERISFGRDKEWADTIVPLQTHVLELVQQVSEQEVHDAAVRRQTEQEQKQKAAEAQERARSQNVPPVDTNMLPMPANSNQGPQSQILENPFHSETDKALSRIKHEATVASQELFRKREETEARQRVAEAKLKQHRETEEILEQQRQRAKAEFDLREAEYKQARAERMEAEEKERLQQEEDARLTAMKEKEKKRKEEEAARLAFLREKLEKEKSVREEERKKMEMEVKQQQLQNEKDREDREEQLRRQNLKRQEVRVQKLRASQETAKKIQATRARNPSTQGQHNDSSQKSQPAFSNPSAAMLPDVIDSPIGNVLSKKNLLGGDLGAADDHHSVPRDRSSISITPLTRVSPSVLQTSAVCKSNSKSVPPVPRRSSLLNNLPPGGLPSPPFEENNIAEDRLGADCTPLIAKSSLGGEHLHEAIAATQTYGNTNVGSLMTLPQYSNSPSTPPRSLATIEPQDISVESRGPDAGNLPLLSRSQTTPISPDAQKSNLRKLMEIEGVIVKRDPEGDKSVFEATKGAFLNTGVGPISSDNKPIFKSEALIKKLKMESPSDYHIPPLSMPSPSTESSHKEMSPTLPMPEKEKSKQKLPSFQRHILNPADGSSMVSRQNLPLPSRLHLAKDRTIQTKATHQNVEGPNVSVAVPSGSRPVQVVMPAPFPAKLPPTLPPPQAQTIYQGVAITNFNEGDDCRMGPDAATPGGWSVPLHPSPIEEDPPEQRRRVGTRLPQKVDHYSPSPPPPPPVSANSRGLVARSRLSSRRVDHYSPPRRSPAPLGPNSLSRNSPGPSWSRGSGSGGNSRDVSPGAPAYYRARRNSRRSPSPEPDAQNGRKRMRDAQDVAGPPPRRPRYTDNRAHREMDNPNTSDAPYQYEDDWSRTANYGRSPSPEPRSTPLALRLEEVTDSAWLPVHRPGANPHSDQVQRRETMPSYTRAVSSENNVNAPNNPQRQNIREPNNDSRPQLLNRFTDLPVGGLPAVTSDPGHYPPNYKGPRARKQPYPRTNGHQQQQPLEQRLSNKGSLMNRLQ